MAGTVATTTAHTTLSNWTFSADNVYGEAKEGQFVSAETTLIAAGPPSPRVIASGDTDLDDAFYPIGLLENFAVQQSKQLQRVFEIGSARSYFIPGRVVGSFTVGRVFYHGPSLLRALYAYYVHDGKEEVGGIDSKFATTAQGTYAENLSGQAQLTNIPSLHDNVALAPIEVAAGADNLYSNLASDLFNKPTGVVVMFKDSDDKGVSAMYLQNSYIQGHQISISAGAVIVMEGVSAQFDVVVPVSLSTSAPGAAAAAV